MSNSLSEKEFKNLYINYFASLSLYANRFIKDLDVSKDIVSDVFAIVWQNRDRLDFEDNKGLSYLKTSVRHRALNHLRHQDYKWNHVEYVLNQPQSNDSSPDHIYNVEELYELLKEGLKDLSEPYREVFIQSVMQDKTHDQIASERNVSLRTVNRHKQKALAHLQKVFKDYLAVFVL